MRCVVRIILLTSLAFIFLIYLAVSHANSKIVVAFDENDEEARRILDDAIPNPTASPNSHQYHGPKQSLSVSVALVLIVSLISVALLITGIIIIAVTLDPSNNNEDDDESDLEADYEAKPKKNSNGYYPYDFSSSSKILSEL